MLSILIIRLRNQINPPSVANLTNARGSNIVQRELAGVLVALLSSCLGGTAVVATRHLVGALDPLTLALTRFGLGTLCLAVPFLCYRLPFIGRRDLLPVVLLGVLFFAGFPALFNQALAWTTAARGALVLATMPLLTLLLAAILRAEALTGRKLAGVLLAFAGVALALGGSGAIAPPGAWRGDLVMLAAAMCGAVYNVAVRPLLRRHPPLAFITQAMLAGTVVLAIASAMAGEPARLIALPPREWGAVVYLGLVGGALALWLWTLALELTTPTRVAVTVTANPVVASGLGLAVLGEPVAVPSWLDSPACSSVSLSLPGPHIPWIQACEAYVAAPLLDCTGGDV